MPEIEQIITQLNTKISDDYIMLLETIISHQFYLSFFFLQILYFSIAASNLVTVVSVVCTQAKLTQNKTSNNNQKTEKLWNFVKAYV